MVTESVVAAPMRRRNGYSLIEMTVVITTGAAMMANAVGLVGSMLRLDRHCRDYAHQRGALSRLADQFRRDVHAAVSFKTVDAPAGAGQPAWQLQLTPKQTVEYRVRAGELVRTEHVEGKIRSTESYRLPAHTTVAIQLDERAKPPVVSLRLAADGQQPAALGARASRIDATLAKDQRFLKAKGS